MKDTIINKDSIKYLTELDTKFKTIIEEYGLPPSWSRKEGFESLCRIILEQQVSLESGKAAYEKLKTLTSSFTPKNVAKLTMEQMRAATVSRQKSGYILGLASTILDGNLNLTTMSGSQPNEAVDRLVKIKGIGPWTAEVYTLFALRAPDIYPRGDIALINTIKELWHVADADEALNKTLEWAPYRSTASFLLWHHYLSKRGRVSPI